METQQKIHIGQNIRQIATKKNIEAETLAYRLKRSQANIYQIFNKPDISTGLLLELSAVLGEPVAAFFGDVYNRVEVVSNQPDAKQDSENRHLKKLLAEKDKQIALQEELLEMQRAQLVK